MKPEGPPPPLARSWRRIFRVRNRRGEIMGSRKIYVDRPFANSRFHFSNNHISTTKYNLITFLPKNLFEQFRRVANFWFLLTACLQLIPDITPTNPLASFLPFFFVLGITAVKEFYEDWVRRRSDREINNRPVTLTRGGVTQKTVWSKIRVGDIVHLANNELVPADLVVLSTNDPEGTCYLETAAIDGETNLKRKNALKETNEFGQDFSNFDAEVECQTPNPSLYQFNGTISFNGNVYSIGLRQFLFRGCVLRNTEWLYGLAVYTGHETKLMKNATNPPSKRSLLEKEVNYALMQMFGYIILLCFFCGTFAGCWVAFWGDDHFYLDITSSGALTGVKGFVTFMILYSVMIPLSLYVTIELVKVGLGFFIDHDLRMYHKETDTPARARTTNLTEQLGQLEYIFSDKTGTLTSNQMEFRQCSIAGHIYGTFDATPKAVSDDPDAIVMKQTFNDPEMQKEAQSSSDLGKDIRKFWTLLAVCHTVMIQPKGEDDFTYSAASPDEAALVQAAREQGYVFHNEDDHKFTISVNGVNETYEILNILEFNSDRKRMSVIVRCPDGKIRLFCKGADTVIFQRAASGQDELIRVTIDHLRIFARQGLRTLNLGYIELDEDEYAKWQELWIEASQALHDRESKLDDLAEIIEKDLILLGATAIEDRLQDGVPETIAILSQANLKIWVLTGDKEETAVNIGFSCHLLTHDQYLMIINSDSFAGSDDIMDGMRKYTDECEMRPCAKALVIDGLTLDKIFGNKEMERQLFLLGKQCKAVVCCRCSPRQKSLIVELIQKNDKAQCLAIGDGANDVPMIQAAQIGVGISGREGMQAVNASDYAIAQFRFLERLVLVHGRWAYKRLSKLILYSFYKNMCFAMCQFWFAWWSGFSGQTMFESWAMAMFNTLFASLPIFVFALFDQDVPDHAMKDFPELYESGQKSQEFSKRLYWCWVLLGIVQSVINFYLSFYQYRWTVMHWDGTNYGLFAAGTTSFTVLIFVVNIVVMFEINFWTYLNFLASFISIGSWFMFCVVYQYVSVEENNEMFYLMNKLFCTPTYWLLVLLATAACIWPYLSWKVLRRNYFPLNYHIVQEIVAKGRLRYSPQPQILEGVKE